MDRNNMLMQMDQTPLFDLIVIGGGATGLGCALDSVSRGYKTLLVEQADFSSGTSSKSTKLIHGGIRYLREGRLSFVFESLKERFLLAQNAPHLVHPLPFLIPSQNVFQNYYYLTGLKLYDLLSGKNRFPSSYHISRDEMLKRVPTLSPDHLSSGVCYFDAQFDDARLAIDLAKTITDRGGVVINYMQVQNLIKEKGKTAGIIAKDLETEKTYEVFSKAVINATGAFADEIRKMDGEPGTCITPSQGTHIVLDRSFYPSDFALVIPKTSDGRVIFIIPWENKVLIGTTDVPINQINLEPKPTESEITYLLEYARKYLTKHPQVNDILSVFAGIRPLICSKNVHASTASLSREHMILVSKSSLISVIGGKWTTYRKMGEEVVNIAAKKGDLPPSCSKTEHLRIHGSDAASQVELASGNSALLEKFHRSLPCRPIDVMWGIRKEMARKVDDILSRRNRSLLLDAKASIEIAPKVAVLMAKELGKDEGWQQNQIEKFKQLAANYLP